MAAGTDEESTVLDKGPCPSCTSSDAFATYSDGHGYCFSCETLVPSASDPSSSHVKRTQREGLLDNLQYQELSSRNLREETLRTYGYGIGRFNGKACHVAPYINEKNQVVAQKIRLPNKEFLMLGEGSTSVLFGQHLLRGNRKMLVVTEGEIDAMSVYQSQGSKWPAVSVPRGAQSASKAILQNIELLEEYDKVIFMFDMDSPGQEAARECAEVLSPGKAYIARLPLKDPNEMLVAGRSAELSGCVWDAKQFRPDGIVNAADCEDKIFEFPEMGLPYPYKGVTEMTHGIRGGELVTVCAGSGVGKSAFCRELAVHLRLSGTRVGYIGLEENIRRSLHGFLGICLDKPLHLGRGDVTDEQLREAHKRLTHDRGLSLYDHFGSLNSDALISRIRYMILAEECDFIVLDHISIVVSGDTEIDDERRALDVIMTKLRSLVEQTGVSMMLVSHLKRPEGKKGHEEGLQTSLSHLRGSASIAQLSDIVIGLERDQQSTEDKDLTTVRVLKNRHTGDTGAAAKLRFDRETGRLLEETNDNEFTHMMKDETSDDF